MSGHRTTAVDFGERNHVDGVTTGDVAGHDIITQQYGIPADQVMEALLGAIDRIATAVQRASTQQAVDLALRAERQAQLDIELHTIRDNVAILRDLTEARHDEIVEALEAHQLHAAERVSIQRTSLQSLIAIVERGAQAERQAWITARIVIALLIVTILIGIASIII